MVERVLALDLGGSLGWVAGSADCRMPDWGVIELPQGSYGHIFNALCNAVEDLIDRTESTVIGVEDPIPQRGNSIHTARVTLGWHAIVDMVCEWRGIKPVRKTVSHIRSSVIGRAQRTALEREMRITVKDAVVLPWINRMEWEEISDHNARDAAVLWAYMVGMRAPRKLK